MGKFAAVAAAISLSTAELFAAVSAVASVSGAVGSVVMGKKAQGQQQRQFEESQAERRQAEASQRQLADLNSLRNRRAAAREAQQRRAEIVSAGVQRGATGSSSVRGASASVGTQAGGNVSFLDSARQLQDQATVHFGNAQAIASQPIFISPIPAGVSAIGNTIFAARNELSNIFTPGSTTTTDPNAGFSPASN